MGNIGYKSILNKGQFVFTIKKSKFIGNSYPVTSKQEAEKYIEHIKDMEKNARHNCYAYRVIENGVLIERFSDDGEPKGTAGIPILEILRKEGLSNILVVVTRYFGGILLGATGLLRAYSTTAKNAVSESKIVEKKFFAECEIKVNYESINLLEKYFSDSNIKVVDKKYFDMVIFNILIDDLKKDEILNKIKNITLGKYEINIKGGDFYPIGEKGYTL